MTLHTENCEDCRLSRRSPLKGAALFSAAGVAVSMFADVLTSTAFGATNNNILVVISLPGGADGLSMMVPHAEPSYYSARRGIAVAKSRLLVADSTFGLHPSFAPLMPMWRSGKMAASHAVGLPVPNRSHFEAMELLEDADPGSSARVGWINRMIVALAEPEFFNAVQLGDAVMPTSLVGPNPTLAATDFSGLDVPYGEDPALSTLLNESLAYQYRSPGSLIGSAGQEALVLAKRAREISAVEKNGPKNGAVYAPEYSKFGKALKSSAALIPSGVGVKAIAVDFGGWDHHVDLQWRLKSQATELATNLNSFFTDLALLASKVTVVTLSEFGRRLNQNGAAGVDHGYGNAVFAMGAGVKGGYYAKWPTLATGNRIEGGLAVTTDYRNVVAEILKKQFPAIDTTKVFPGVKFKSFGFMS